MYIGYVISQVSIKGKFGIFYFLIFGFNLKQNEKILDTHLFSWQTTFDVKDRLTSYLQLSTNFLRGNLF